MRPPFKAEVADQAPLLYSAVGHLVNAYTGNLSLAQRNAQIKAAFDDLRRLNQPGTLHQRIAYVALLAKYGIINTIDIVATPVELLKAISNIVLNFERDILAAALWSQQTGDFTLNTPIVIELRGNP